MILRRLEYQQGLIKFCKEDFIVYDSNFKEIERLNIRSRLSPDIVPSINALRVNRLKMAEVLSEN